jgi:hypothetical protein
MALHDSYAELAKDVHSRLEAGAVALGLAAVYYGDQDRIPVTPAVTVEPNGKDRRLNGLPRRTEVTLSCFIFVYHYRLDSPETIRSDNDELTEAVEAFLHQDAPLRDSLGQGTVIDSMVTSIESGVMAKRNTLFRASRLTFEARSQMQLPIAP